MLPVQFTFGGLAAADDDNICASQTPAAAGAMTINGIAASGGVATLDMARRALITSAADDSGITFRVTGTNADGNPIRETVTGPNATTASTVQDFKTVTEVYASGAAAGAVKVGTSEVASSPWKLSDTQHNTPASIAWATTVSGTINYDIEYTMQNPNNNQNTMGGAAGNYPSTVTAINVTNLDNKAVAAQGSMSSPIYAWRATINSGTGSVTVNAIEAGLGG